MSYLLHRLQLSLLSLTLLSAVRTSAQTFQPISPASKLSSLINAAREQGLTQVTLNAPRSMPTGVDTLAEVLREYSLIVATLVDKETVMAGTGSLETWYRVRVSEYLHKQPHVTHGALPSEVPTRFQALTAPAEVVLSVSGGTLTVEGITISQKPPDRFVLRPFTTYVLAVLLEADGKRATLADGPSGVFIASDGDSLVPATERHSALGDDVQHATLGIFSVLRHVVVAGNSK